MYTNICRGLFERDKVLFSALLCFSILRQRGDINPHSWSLFLRGAGPVDRSAHLPNPNPVRITEFQWDLLYAAEARISLRRPEGEGDSVGDARAPFAGCPAAVGGAYGKWTREWIDADDPVTAPLPMG
jgi:hypothetical protein